MSILDFNGEAWGIPAGGLHSASYCPPIVPAPAGTEPNPPADPLRRHNQVIPEAAVDAAWDSLLERGRTIPLDYAALAAALEAAAPHMLAEALEDAAAELDGKRLLSKPFHEYYPEWLRKRANDMRAK